MNMMDTEYRYDRQDSTGVTEIDVDVNDDTQYTCWSAYMFISIHVDQHTCGSAHMRAIGTSRDLTINLVTTTS